MKRYYIKNEEENFWCEMFDDKHISFGFWSKYKHALKDRFEENIFFILPLFISMKMKYNGIVHLRRMIRTY